MSPFFDQQLALLPRALEISNLSSWKTPRLDTEVALRDSGIIQTHRCFSPLVSSRYILIEIERLDVLDIQRRPPVLAEATQYANHIRVLCSSKGDTRQLSSSKFPLLLSKPCHALPFHALLFPPYSSLFSSPTALLKQKQKIDKTYKLQIAP